jgi:hypothetical protein
MRVRILDLDGGLSAQSALRQRYLPAEFDVRAWGPRLRLACRFGRFARFERALDAVLGSDEDRDPTVTLYGSGDFHHVSLALLRRLTQPFNLLVVDKHPDWMRAIPFLHCGTWVRHAAHLPQVRRIFHVGGDLDFDNGFRWLAPWRLLRSGKITVFPGLRSFARGAWRMVPNLPVRLQPERATTRERLGTLLEADRADLERWPLYISIDKDVMAQEDAVVNWDSGRLSLVEVILIVQAFLGAAGGNLAGMDIVGDWSPVRLRGVLRRFLHLTEHPPLAVDADAAAVINEQTNLRLLDVVRAQIARRRLQQQGAAYRLAA